MSFVKLRKIKQETMCVNETSHPGKIAGIFTLSFIFCVLYIYAILSFLRRMLNVKNG